MGVFDDKKFEQLDWMTQITETIDSELNTVLAALPERYELPIDVLFPFLEHSNGLSLTTHTVVNELLKQINYCEGLSYDEKDKIVKCFKFELSENAELDLVNNNLTGHIALVKTISTFVDEDLQGMLGGKGLESLRRFNWQNGSASRMNEVIELLGSCESILKNRSTKKKMTAIYCRLGQIFQKNEWRIRDMDLSNKIGFWISQYIDTGNLAAFTNFCKVKVMTHNNMPIYSIQEEQ